MGNTATKFRKALLSGDEGLAWQLYESNPQFKEALDPNASYGEPYQHNTALHYASRHAMTRLIRSFIFSKDGNPNKCNIHNETALHLLCMGPQILLGEGALQPRISRPQEDEQKRAECLQMILQWTGAKLDQGEYERANVNGTDNKKSTCLHYAAAAGMKNCVELLVKSDADLFMENEDRKTPCDCAEKQHHKELALSLESQMVFSQDAGAQEIEAEYTALDRRECGICMCPISVFEDPVDMSCGHEFCRACWEGFLNLKIQEGEAHNIVCPAYDCFQLVPVEVIESIVSREMDKRYLQFDIKAFVDNNPAIRWCPVARCERAVRLTRPGPGASDPLSFPLLKAPAVDCGKGHLFCWECLCDAHEPCDCETWKMWLQKVSEMKPEELAGVSEAYEDAANCLWLLTNSKPCANCKSPIQKNEGCNHMQCAKCKYDFCWICLEEWKKHSSSTGGYYRCTRYEIIQQVEEQSKDMTVEAEKKHKSFQELNCFMHYYTRYKNHEHSYQLEERLLKTAKEKMEQLSKAFIGREGSPPDTTFIEDGVHELLKTRRILKCSYPYSFFLEPKSTKKEIFELMQTDLEMVTEDLAQKVNRPYLRTPRHKIISATYLVQQKRREFLASVARGVAPNDSPEASRRSFAGGTWDWEYLGFASPEMVRNHPVRGSNTQRESNYNPGSQPQEYSEFQYRRRHRQRRRGDLLRLQSLHSTSPEPHDSNDNTLETHDGDGLQRHGISTAHGSLDEDDPNILLAIQLSLQESGLALDPESQDVLSTDPSVGASGSSLPSRLDSAPHTVDPPRASMSSSELLELGDSLMRLGNITSHYTPFNMNSYPNALGNAFTPTDPDFLDPSTNANLLGNIMAWFHDMNPQSIALIPSNAGSDPLVSGEGHEEPVKPQEEENEVGRPEQGSPPLTKESAGMLMPQCLELECVDDAQPSKVEPDLEDLGRSEDLTGTVCQESSSDRDVQVTDLSEWEEEMHLV
ncbi:ankyrin repeat and IBR domain-containing protein 1-like isoform X4 [Myxocyprinus asiaticus]|uniref:ankyrin repeat and IBR domain-containing protein 1-like isoform X4 n=1 Tax=Myxocyprinus asiaticus TaxID=70543 RepID=UPI00222189A2|nr:ankyrin repeat and IBR domain-containing protein 1-like isoform X4 [Myxocyprinus asiaticus]